MKIPQHGCLVDPDTGKVLWAWINGDPSRELDLLPPIIMREDGTLFSMALPHHHVVDLESFTYDEMQEIVKDHAALRLRVEQGSVRVKKVHTFRAEGELQPVEVEVDHPMEQVRQLRRARHAQKK